MQNDWQGYLLNVQGVVCFRRVTDKYGQDVFVKKNINYPCELYIEKSKANDKTGNSIDVITGRIFSILECEDNIMLFPSGISLNKNSLVEFSRVYESGLPILENKEQLEEYTQISEDVLINTYFCERICDKLGVSEVPAYILEEEIKRFRQAKDTQRVRK